MHINGPLGAGAQPGLHDHHAHALEVVSQLVLHVGRCRVHHELRVVLGVHRDTPAELGVDDDQLVHSQDHGVGGAVSIILAGHVPDGQPLLDQQLAAGGLDDAAHRVHVGLDRLRLLNL